MMNEDKKFKHIAPEKFRMVQQDAKISDVKFDTKPVGYFKDAFSRFKKNKSSVTAAIIIIFLLLFAIFGPMFSKYETTDIDGNYKQALPKASAFVVTLTFKRSLVLLEFSYYVSKSCKVFRYHCVFNTFSYPFSI